jgi:hypothetical protein
MITPAYAVDYLYEASKRVGECYYNGNCAEFKKYTNDGIYYYSSRKNNSYNDLQSYCALLGYRATTRTASSTEQFQKDLFNLKRYCGLFGF